MKQIIEIVDVLGREILDSRGKCRPCEELQRTDGREAYLQLRCKGSG